MKVFPMITLAFRLALREMRGGLSGFRIFIACIALGTAAIAAINSVSSTIRVTMAAKGEELLAGDMRFELTNRLANEQELAFLRGLGTLSHSTTLRSMVRTENGEEQTLSELKAVDEAYPLYGRLEVKEGGTLASRLATHDGTDGALAGQALLDRLGIKVGDRVFLGSMPLVITGTIKSEPDSISEGFAFAPRLLLSSDALERTGLVQLGSLTKQAYRIKLDARPQDKPIRIDAIVEKAKADFPDAGWAMRRSANAAPSLSDNIDRFTQFLTLVGLTALIVGGVGIGNSVRAYLDSKRTTIATFKCLGAPSGLIILIYFIQILLIALIGIGIGLLLGAAAPALALPYLAAMLPVESQFQLYPSALALAAGFGLLTTVTFSILPLGVARGVSAVTLFRDAGDRQVLWPGLRSLTLLVIAMASLATLAVLTAEDQRIAVNALVAIAAGFIGLRLVGLAVSALARRAPRFRSPALRLAIGNIHRPGALTGPVVLSLGLGLALLVGLSLIDVNLRQQLTGDLAAKAPNFFFIDIQSRDRDGFEQAVKAEAPKGTVNAVPMLRGRITKLNDQDVATANIAPEGKWVLTGDRGITYSEALPANSRLTEGRWWEQDHKGKPLVSFSAEEARNLGLKVGDTITVNVLGRSIAAEIANLRKVEWDSMSINFVMVFSPNTFAGAPHSWLATLTDPSLDPGAEAAVLKNVAKAYPAVTSIRVKDALDVIAALTGQLADAIRAAAAIALVTSVLVLAGALAAGNRARLHDAVVMKTLGATRSMLIRTYVLEYGLLGLSTALFATAAGGLSAWYVLDRIMKLPFTLSPGPVLTTLVIGLVITIGIGLAGTWAILGQKPAQHLREL